MSISAADVDAIVRRHLGEADVFSAAVLEPGRLVVRHTAVQPALPIYSLTKTFIAGLVLDAVSAGRLSLETTLAEHCPDVPEASRLTLRQLLSHTAGLPDYGALPEYHRAVAAGAPAWDFERFADATYRRGLLYPPGTGWAYSNPGYALLVRILERVWSLPLERLLRERLLEPLHLKRTRLVHTLDDPALSPPGTDQGEPANHYDPGWVWHRLLASDAADCARFLDALLRRQWLGAELTAAMTELVPVPGQHPPWSRPGYGLGLMGERAGARGPVFGHNGEGPGYTASAFHFTATGATVAVVAAMEAPEAVLDAVFALHDALAGA